MGIPSLGRHKKQFPYKAQQEHWGWFYQSLAWVTIEFIKLAYYAWVIDCLQKGEWPQSNHTIIKSHLHMDDNFPIVHR